MKPLFIIALITSLVLVLSLLISPSTCSSTTSTRVKVEVPQSTHMLYSSWGLRKNKNSPKQRVESCFRAIPPSKSNPTQNK
ncbi:hypothetical protein AAHE18_18G092800 [Arachis hypogaea]